MDNYSPNGALTPEQSPDESQNDPNLREAQYWQQRSIIAADASVRLFGTLDGVLFSIASHQYAARATYYRELADAVQTGGVS